MALASRPGDEGANAIQPLVNELKNGRLADLPDVKLSNKQLNPKLHDVNDVQLRPDKMVVVDQSSEDYGQVQNVNPNAEIAREGVRIEKVARIAVAIQKLIVKRAVAFLFGLPAQYNANTADDEMQAAVHKALKRIFYDVKINSVDRREARQVFEYKEVAEYWYPVEVEEHGLYGFNTTVKFKVATFSPSFGDILYPYFDETHDLVAFSREFTRKDIDLIERTYFETFTKDNHYLWSCQRTKDGGDDGQWRMEEGYPKPITIGKIPIVYGGQPQVEWADVQNLIDRLEKLLSNFADTNDYHGSPKIFVEGKVVGFTRKGEAGGIIEGQEGAKAQYLTWANAPESVKLEISTLLNLIYTLTQTPDISFDSVKGLNVSGVALKLLFMDAHLKVQDKSEIFIDFLQRRVNILLAYLAAANKKQEGWEEAAKSIIVEPVIRPYMIEDEQAQANTLMGVVGNKPIASRRTAIQRLGWTEDVDAEESQIELEEQAAATFAQGEPTI